MRKALCLLCVLLLLVGCASVSGGPTPAREGENWDREDVLAHLEKQGVEFTVKGKLGAEGELVPPTAVLSIGGNKTVDVSRRKSAKAAKDWAANHGESAFSWGRFAFVGSSKEAIAPLRKALE